MITKDDFINLYTFQDLTVSEIRSLKSIFADGVEAFLNLHFIDDDEMEGDYKGITIRAKRFDDSWLIYDNKGGVLECEIPIDNKLYDYLDRVYYLTKKEYLKDRNEIEATYKILSILM